MILYSKAFPLRKDLSFWRYLHGLDQKNFPPYTLVLEEVTSDGCRAEILFTHPLRPFGWVSAFPGEVFLDRCHISYMKGRNRITLEASANPLNLLLASVMGLLVMICALVLLYLGTTRGMAASQLFAACIILAIVLTPYLMTYIREKRLLETIGSLAFQPDQH